jgi:hypothetical protein
MRWFQGGGVLGTQRARRAFVAQAKRGGGTAKLAFAARKYMNAGVV